MAARAPEGPGDAASAALDELSRNFTYGALGAGNGSLSGAWYRRNQIHLFGVLLAILGNLVISVSLNIQKYSHLHLVHQEHQRPFFRSVLWWGGILLMAVGETGNFAAYGFAPITLIAPLGCMSVTGMTLAFAGTYLLVNFAPNITQSVSARTVQYYFVGWQFLIYVILEILAFCILLYVYKRKGMKHIVILLTLVALLASLTVISGKAVSGMITFSVMDKMQLTYPIFYIMFIVMIASCVFQVKFLNQATKLYNTTTVVPVNHIFFTTSAIIAEQQKKEMGEETGNENGAEVARHCYSVLQRLRERVATPADRRALPRVTARTTAGLKCTCYVRSPRVRPASQVSYFIRNSLEQLFSLYLSIFLGVFCHSLVCSWSQEIEKRNICHSLTLILEIFLGNKCWTKYNQIQMAYPMELCLMGVTQQRAKVERRKRSRMPEGWLLACYSDHLCKRLHVFSLCQQLFYTDMC
ncbi:NIPA-like protein 2 isoform X2 [Manis pentadactyla]|uniref:NIPA-like protein 2 isoform X2 n=1 Tax=Manis pentadactyla TaxID=143292 RepID=UPI00255CF19D|nr:NIPA-like protein 2 isoform X2 [Manis pentadactyla]